MFSAITDFITRFDEDVGFRLNQAWGTGYCPLRTVFTRTPLLINGLFRHPSLKKYPMRLWLPKQTLSNLKMLSMGEWKTILKTIPIITILGAIGILIITGIILACGWSLYKVICGICYGVFWLVFLPFRILLWLVQSPSALFDYASKAFNAQSRAAYKDPWEEENVRLQSSGVYQDPWEEGSSETESEYPSRAY